MRTPLLALAILLAATGSAAAGKSVRTLDSTGPLVVLGKTDLQYCVMETEAGNVSEGLYWCDRVVRRGETDVNARSVALLHRGVLRTMANDFTEAMADVDRSIELTPHYGDAWFSKGNIFYALGDFQAAVDAFSEALTREPSTPELVYYNRAKAYERLGQGQKAAADLQAAAQAMPADSPLVGRIAGKR